MKYSRNLSRGQFRTLNIILNNLNTFGNNTAYRGRLNYGDHHPAARKKEDKPFIKGYIFIYIWEKRQKEKHRHNKADILKDSNDSEWKKRIGNNERKKSIGNMYPLDRY